MEYAANIIGTALCSALIGEAGGTHRTYCIGKAGCIRSANNNVFADFLFSPRFTY
jgi:hypothetical protein